MSVCVFSVRVSLLHLQRCLIEECDELSSQQHNHLFSQELYSGKDSQKQKDLTECVVDL